MNIAILITLCLIYHQVCGNNKFPSDFKFGVASSAYQIEGGRESRAETAFDHFRSLDPSMVSDGSTADVACDSYHRYHDDIEMVVDLGVDFYRFSIAWSRILPSGHSNFINHDGIRYYNAIIDGLLAKNIEPVVTIHHFDLPYALENLGGWKNPLLADLFEDYSRILFQNFGDRVKTWITFNSNFWGCGDEEWGDKTNRSGIGEYWCIKTTLLAHAKVYHLYQKEFKHQNGQIGFTLDGRWYEPATPGAAEAAERVRQFNSGILLNPIFGSGDFPEIVKKRVNDLSKKEGFLRSRLPLLTSEEVEYIKGSYDFLGLNVYTTFLVEDDQNDGLFYSFDKDMGAKIYQDPRWKGALSSWLKVVPWGFRNVLKWIKTNYGNPPIIVTENGFSDGGEIEDFDRIEFYKEYLGALLEAIYDDGVQVKGYAAWSLMDNFEWFAGYSEKFGLYHVDFAAPTRPRTPKSSAKWYKNFLATRHLAPNPKSEL